MTTQDKTMLYLDDLYEGQTFVSGEHALDENQIISFAQTYDPQRFHLSNEGAKDSMFGTLAASGWHTAAITMKLLVDSIPIADGVIGAGGEITWPAPTRPDDILHTESTILEIRPSRSKPNQAIVMMESRTLNQRGDLRQRFLCKLVAFRKA